MSINREVFKSEHFNVEQLDNGIFALIHREHGWAVANSGIIDLGKSSLVFDTFLTVQAATDLREAAEQLTGKPVGIVINSHYHNDHIWGNQVFDPETKIIASAETRDLITTKGKEEYDWFNENSAIQLRELQSKYENEEDEDERRHISQYVSYYQGLVETFPVLEVRLPNETFIERVDIHGADFDVELIAFKGGHTGCDTVLHIPSKGILFMSDLLFVGSHPYLPDGDPRVLLSILDEIDTLEARILVPGHGPVGTMDDLELMKDYILHCDQAAKRMVEEGQNVEEIKTSQIPEQYSSWIYPIFYPANVKCFYKHHQSELEDRES